MPSRSTRLTKKPARCQANREHREQTTTRRYSPRAALAAIGAHLRHLKMLEPVRQRVVILQKSIQHTPFQKLTDAFITILAGAHGLAEVNTRLRSDEALQRAFGRTRCAEQSVVQETLSASTPLNIQQMQIALDDIFRTHSRAYRHNYKETFQLLDIDLSGMPCGAQQEQSTLGYFGETGIRYGRQLGRVIATHYEEIVTDQLFAGNVNLFVALPTLVAAAEATLELDEERRRRTVLRIDAGGGSLEAINSLLTRGYHVHAKDVSSVRAEAVAQTVVEWFACPQQPGREIGWVTLEASDYMRPVRRLAMRWRKRNGQRMYALVLSSLEPCDVIGLLHQPAHFINDAHKVALAYAKFYDLRGGGVETQFKEDKQGFGMTKRAKKKFEGQQMVMLLGALAHNVMVWARGWLSKTNPRLVKFGVLRLVRDILTTSGFVELTAEGTLTSLTLNRAAPAAKRCRDALSDLLKAQRVTVDLGVT